MLRNLKETYNIFGYVATGKIFDIFMMCVYNLGQFHSIDEFLINIHWNSFRKFGRIFMNIVANDFGNYRTPVTKKKVLNFRVYFILFS